MKVIFITRENSQMPAVRVRCYNFAKYLEKEGISTEVFSYADELGAKSGSDERKMSWLEKIYYNFQAYCRLSRQEAIFIIQRFNYHSFAPLFLGIFKGRKLIFDLDDWEAREDIRYYFNKVPSSKAEMMMRFIAGRSVMCIGASRFLFDYLCRYNHNVIYLPTAVDADLFKPCPRQIQNSVLVLSWLGTMHRKDNLENIRFLIECFHIVQEAYPQVRLEVCGEGIFYEQVQDLVRQCGNRSVMLKPWIDPENIPRYLQGVDIGVMPLIQDTKFNRAKSPTRLFEYMAMAKPVVASCIGEAKEIIDNGINGLLAETKEEFAAGLKALISNENMRKSFGENARRKVEEKFSLKKTADKLVEEIRKL